MANEKGEGRSRRGFGAMDREQQRRISRKGGESVRPEDRSFSRDRALASAAGRKGAVSRNLAAKRAREAAVSGGQVPGGQTASGITDEEAERERRSAEQRGEEQRGGEESSIGEEEEAGAMEGEKGEGVEHPGEGR